MFWVLSLTICRTSWVAGCHGRSCLLECANSNPVMPMGHRPLASEGKLGPSATHLRRRFKAAFGCAPMEYLERVRMEQAARLIEESELSMKEVARTVGYLDANNFSTAFKRFHGNTPQSHRRAATA